MPEREKPSTSSQRPRFERESAENRLLLVQRAFDRATNPSRWQIIGGPIATTVAIADALQNLDEHNARHIVAAYAALEHYWNELVLWAAAPDPMRQHVAEALNESHEDMQRLFSESGRCVPITRDRLTAVIGRLRTNLENHPAV